MFLGKNVPIWRPELWEQGGELPQWVIDSDDEGELNMSPQNVPLWHIDHFELKLLKKQPAQEGHSDPPLSPESRKSPM